MRHVFKLTGLRSKGRPGMFHFFFSTFCEFQEITYFLVSIRRNHIILDIAIDIRSTVIENGVFQSV